MMDETETIEIAKMAVNYTKMLIYCVDLQNTSNAKAEEREPTSAFVDVVGSGSWQRQSSLITIVQANSSCFNQVYE